MCQFNNIDMAVCSVVIALDSFEFFNCFDGWISGKAFQGELKISMGNGETRILRSTPDWEESAISDDHLWVNSSASGDLCYVGDNDCSKQGPRMRCPSCKITAHTRCINTLIEKMKFHCKPTFKDVGVRQYREQTVIHHHWVHRRSQKGKCNQCGKSFQSKLPFGAKQEILAISCSWCKIAYHNKETCFNMQRIGEQCTLGIHSSLIVPPSWIVKLPRKGSFKSSLRRSPKKRASSKKKPKKEGEKELPRTFVIKPIPSVNSKPLLVFINPKSGGNQGAKLMQKFQWLLNPRQVFDLSQGGPAAGLELYKKVPNLRILACGGDGTAGWILSVLDELGISPQPPLAVLPLGTGNDLARALGWGGGYTDEPISKILINVQEGNVTQLDRWDLSVQKNTEVDLSQCEEGKEYFPLHVVNNYFSLGVDAHIALEFHEAREARPDKFNSRLRNKMFYGQAGGKDLLQRKWKDLCSCVTLECDDQDLTPRLKELKVHSVLFLNIPSYGGGTHPWGNPTTGFEMQKTDDGLIEVIGLTTYQLPFLQAGGHGTCLAQCRKARLITTKTIPMQVDGEPCRLLPSIIELSLRNQANVISKTKQRHDYAPRKQTLEKLTLDVRKLTMSDYETYHYDKEKLKEHSSNLGSLHVNQDTDLQEIRSHINQLIQNCSETEHESSDVMTDWCFLDSCTAERFFRIDFAQEHLHYVVDICADEVFILDQGLTEVPETEFNPTGNCEGLNVLEGDNNTFVVDKDEKDLEDITEESSSSAMLLTQEMFEAVKSGNLAKLKELHKCGCSLLRQDQDGMTVLHYAAELGCREIVSYLITCVPHSALDIVDKLTGQTPLHKAVLNKHHTISCMLVSAGASLMSLDNENLTPRDLAKQIEDNDLADYLESQERFCTFGREKETAV
ncbi:diacylglycerol kinase iota isoform X1 [Centruroides vittatus]|uniref:diacylglycerol kinase iota isoform X1 n=3 Tax=Centruroides vittatus TaxID=120091 RepID=UPI00350EAB9C